MGRKLTREVKIFCQHNRFFREMPLVAEKQESGRLVNSCSMDGWWLKKMDKPVVAGAHEGIQSWWRIQVFLRTCQWDPVAGSGRAPIPNTWPGKHFRVCVECLIGKSGRSRPRLNTQLVGILYSDGSILYSVGRYTIQYSVGRPPGQRRILEARLRVGSG